MLSESSNVVVFFLQHDGTIRVEPLYKAGILSLLTHLGLKTVGGYSIRYAMHTSSFTGTTYTINSRGQITTTHSSIASTDLSSYNAPKTKFLQSKIPNKHDDRTKEGWKLTRSKHEKGRGR